MKTIFAFIIFLHCLLLTASNAMAARSAPLVEKSYVFDGPDKRTREQIRDYILAGAARYDGVAFRIEEDTPGTLQLEFIEDNSQFVSVTFLYDESGFKTKYVKSKNMNFNETNGVRTIHPVYMSWLDEMFVEMKQAYTMQLKANGEPSNPLVVAEIQFKPVRHGTTKVGFADARKSCGHFDTLGQISDFTDEEEALLKQRAEDHNKKYADSMFGKRALVTYTPRQRSLTHLVAVDNPIQVRTTNYLSVGHCGPLDHRFTPRGGRKYAVEVIPILGSGVRRDLGSCIQTISDVTDPSAPLGVPREEIPECKERRWFGL